MGKAHQPRGLTLVTAGLIAAFVFSACTPAAEPTATPGTSQTPASNPPTAVTSEQPSASAAQPSEAIGTPYPSPAAMPQMPAAGIAQYPDYGQVDCANGTFNGLPYGGNLKSISAPDPMTVVFDFCNPDVAFLSQIAFQALAIDDLGYLEAHMADGSILTAPNGTGPYMLANWDHGNRLDLSANPNYWGGAPVTPNVEFQWSDQSAARLVQLQAGTIDGMDNVGKDDIATVQNDPNLAFYPREGLNTLYLGMNNTVKPWDNQKVRQAIAMGIDRQKIVDSYYPPGSEVASYFTPCAIPDACGGDAYYDFNAAAAKQLLDEGLQEEGIDPATFSTKVQFRAAVRSYLPDPPTIAQEIVTQLHDNLGINATLDLQDSGTFLDNNAAGKLDGLFLLGWGADFPDASNFLDYHFGPGSGLKFGNPFPDLVAAIQQGDQSADDAARTAAYTTANNLIKQYVPAVIIAHGGSGTAYKADVTNDCGSTDPNVCYANPLLENFNTVNAGGRDTFVFMQNAEPLSLYCGDESDGETLRACQQIREPLYKYGGDTGLQPVPALATSCTANSDLTEWTCALRPNVKFSDGSDFAADDVIASFAAQWDALSPLHVGRTGDFEYWASLIGQGYLNPPAPCGIEGQPACS
jgi:peptide/nickel transport system substrate-binding protein